MAATANRSAPWMSVPLWAWYAAAGACLLGLYTLVVLNDGPTMVATPVFATGVTAGLVGMLLGIRVNDSSAWWPRLLAGGVAVNLIVTLLPAGAWPVTQPLYLLYYLLNVLALVLVVRRRTPDWDLPGVIDAAIVTIAAGLLSWVFLIGPILDVSDRHPAMRLLSIAYPLGDVLLVALATRLFLGGGRPSVAARVLACYLLLSILPDVLTALHDLLPQDPWIARMWNVSTVMWLAAALLVGLLGLHPSMRDLDAPKPAGSPDAGWGQLAGLALASLLAPATLFVQYLRDAPLHIPLICACCALILLLVIGRLAALVRVQRQMAVTDELTGLRTRRYFQEKLHNLPDPDRGTAVVLLDIDHFKRINDTYGHDGGDRVLREVALRLAGAVRRGDLAARYGGEEFAILLSSTTHDQALAVADRMHAAVRDRPCSAGPDVEVDVTVSAGVACLPTDVDDPGRLTLLADQFLYEAKAAGRDRVVSTRLRRLPESA
ncbi:hypothetical protein AMIS_27150 [Actinoplanes missouriensis 431]|uniref:GGDEF domain-containing protein n=1 Tax=Actinoplanes missouriensis (strain ATCC 14538 / DSM 43046 / CBS 188.64 / JCM 3121 / NBRC 102363 / NCIMB 12654 / NRRL B-3342 / UNCC 431) TaxID=512565 RepID=I0H4J8_ACTM4|nr:GGDEF domain-containing protein [Actinoplanes missouriensis]BAL87935.1 hypothetical protein AMIS_27150 [Actinoplanes missouriensis 431]